ncbi:uncharacterized protein LOC135685081 isoform X1 [Rhopilema esculentum]|uniref:uncharacterized protein LOC135685081 isoform X1 n=2 Tax=Rhopilema esculentum TaxID=499914 RepID=UPI0031D3CFFF
MGNLLTPTVFVPFIGFFIVLMIYDRLPSSTYRPAFYKNVDVCKLLRGLSEEEEMNKCQPRVCLNVIPDATEGRWIEKRDLTQEEVSYRKNMDRDIRLKMKVPWPTSLFRNDSKCGKKYPIPGHDLQGACDPESTSPCCNHVTGYCGNKTEDCNCSQCTDFRKYNSAEISEWVPSDTCCRVKNFTKDMACSFLNKHSISIAFIGDSVIRQLSRTMFLLLSGNLHSGAMPGKATDEERAFCYADHQIAIKKCNLEIVAHKLEELPPRSICNGKVNFNLDLVENYKKYLQDKDMEQIRKYLKREDSYVVLAVGLHYRLDLNKVIDLYVKKVLDVIETEGNGWPKVIWMGIHAVPDFLLMNPLFHNAGILEFNNKIHNYLMRRGVAVIDTFNMSKSLFSYDGLHYGIGLNFLKIQILLNYLEEKYERCDIY